MCSCGVACRGNRENLQLDVKYIYFHQIIWSVTKQVVNGSWHRKNVVIFWAIIVDGEREECHGVGGCFLNKSYVTKMGTTWANQQQVFYIVNEEEQTRTMKTAKQDCANFSNYRPGKFDPIKLLLSEDGIYVQPCLIQYRRHPNEVNTEVWKKLET